MSVLSPVEKTSSSAPLEAAGAPLDAFKISIKFFAEPSSASASDLIPVLHSWIQNSLVPDHLLIDVALYDHVIDGPGTVLVSHEANFSLDREDGKLGLLYFRKQPLPGDFSHRLRSVMKYALHACQLLEQTLPGKIRFRTNDPVVRIHDRLLAPNTPDTYVAVKPVLESVLSSAYGGAVRISHIDKPDQLMGIAVQVDSAPDIRGLLHRLA